jgi:hypothetical protein
VSLGIKKAAGGILVRKITVGPCILYHGSMEAVIPTITFDHVLTDPPYLYLNKEFDKPFDEDVFF